MSVALRPVDVALLPGYDAAVDAIVAALDGAREGDEVDVGLYLLEPGDSSGRVLAALHAAAGRGAAIDLSLDWSLASRLSRLVERTRSLVRDARALERAWPRRVKVELLAAPDHAKRVVVRRTAGGATTVLGGMNLGDRFRPWRDVGVRVDGEGFALAVELALRGEGGPVAPLDVDDGRATLIANAPGAARFDVRPALEDLFGRAELVRYQVAMAYLDRAGVALLRRALDRGAAVDLVLPARANVYDEANRRALALLLEGGGALVARHHPDMVHAKAIVAHDARGPRVALLGSANLKRNSLVLLGELCVALGGPMLASPLASWIDALAAEAAVVAAPPRYRALRAAIEERLG